MRPFDLRICTAVLLGIFSAATPAGATGYWNMPGTFGQCMGIGWGAGYHAPFVLGPIRCDGWCDHKEVRLPYPPAPPSACCGQEGCGYDGLQPSRLDSLVVPPPVPVTIPAPPQVSALFAPPIEQ